MLQWVPDTQKPTPLTAQWKVVMSKRMTLIIGASCSNGLYFCSDTEEGTASGGKRSVHKLCDAYDHPSWHLVLGAAGFGPLCEIAMKRIADAARREKTNFLADHEQIIGQELKRIYDQYVSILLSGQERYERQISLVFGVADLCAKNARLYSTYEEIVYPATERFVCAGAGAEIANYFLDRLFQDWRPPIRLGNVPTTTEGEVLLQFIMKEAKASVGSVGGNTETISVAYDGGSIVHGSFSQGWESKQPTLESIVEHFWLGSA
jgi:20S proteasome alpha/beta subunit